MIVFYKKKKTFQSVQMNCEVLICFVFYLSVA